MGMLCKLLLFILIIFLYNNDILVIKWLLYILNVGKNNSGIVILKKGIFVYVGENIFLYM